MRVIVSDNESPMSDRSQLSDDLERIARRAVQLYAESHPRPTQVNQTQAAEILGVSTRTVRNYIRAGRLKLNRCGMLPIEAIDAMRAPQ